MTDMASREELAKRLVEVRIAIANFEDLCSDMDSPEYVARGNGFCDSKYSEDFIEGRLQTLRDEEASIEHLLTLQ